MFDFYLNVLYHVYRFWYEDHYPLLECSSNESLTINLNITSTENIVELVISFPYLNEFAVDQLARFRNLTKLKINESFLESVLPSRHNFSLPLLTFLSVT